MTKHNILNKFFAVVILAFATAGCPGEQTLIQQTGELPECLKPICEVTMSKVLTEDSDNADFATGLTYPTAGESGSIWWDLIEGDVQQLADRSQALAKFAGVGASNVKQVQVPIRSVLVDYLIIDAPTSRFIWSDDKWRQNSVASTGQLTFEVPSLPVGSTITGAHVWIANPSNTTFPIQYMPTLTLNKNVYTVGAGATPASYDVDIDTVTDPTATSTPYKLMHKVELTGLTEVVTADTVYRLVFTGENGTNAVVDLVIAAAFIDLGL